MSRTTKWLIIATIIGLIILLLRIKAVTPASILSGVLLLATLSQRAIAWWLSYRQLKNARNFSNQRSTAPTTSMTVETAHKILGTKPTATKTQINSAYKQLMQKLHPDTGGNDFLASQINEARDVLLKT